MITRIAGPGTLKAPDLHDGQLTGISMGDDETLTLYCSSVGGGSCTLRIPNVTRLRADNFREGNVIFEVNVYEGEECPEALVGRLYNEGQNGGNLASHMLEIRQKRWALFELTSSYGCELLALSRRSAIGITIELPTSP
jgi:hypothetical protein